jgi:SAM-dependent methyltransferase
MTKEEIEKVFLYHNWRQKIYIKDEVYTPGHIDNDIWKDLGLPENVKGLTVLDIGSNDGQVAFEAEKRGAKKVYASDLYIDQLDTMAKGWPIEGITILKDVKSSNIIIHKEGLFGLDSIKDHFDIVILNDVLNWIGDIDLVIQTIAKLNFNKIYIADQFLISKNQSEKRAPKSIELKPFKELCNISYLGLKLKEYNIESIKVNTYTTEVRHIKKFIMQNNIASKVDVDIYMYPYANATKKGKSKVNTFSYYLYNGFYFIRNTGWVRNEDVLISKNKVNLFLNIFNRMGLLNIYVGIKNILSSKKSETQNYILEFEKIKS